MHGREIEWVDATAKLTTARLRGQTWRLHDIAVGPDHVAHVAVNDIAATITAEQIVEL